MSDRQFVIPTRPGMGRGLVNHDERSKRFRAVALTTETELRTRSWRRGSAYDQGVTPECVAFTGKGMVNTVPHSARFPYRVRSQFDPHAWYPECKRRDEWDGEDYDGTSGLGLCRYLLEIGVIPAYYWAFGLHETLLTLSHVGPVGFGAMWTDGMMDPDADGWIRATGGDVGGHEVEVTGVNVVDRSVTITNTWGAGWGRNGRARLSWDDLDDRLAAYGDIFYIGAQP